MTDKNLPTEVVKEAEALALEITKLITEKSTSIMVGALALAMCKESMLKALEVVEKERKVKVTYE